MEQHALYYKTPYVKEFDTIVISCRAVEDEKTRTMILGDGNRANALYALELKEHGFYPEGGGQAADTGTLVSLETAESCHVISVQECGDTILHYTDHALPEGTTVHAVIDWERRMRNSRNHSGEHIVSGLVHRHYGYQNVGFHMSDVMTIDFDGMLTMEQLLRIEDEANAIVLENRPVQVFFPTPEELQEMEYRSKKELSGVVRLVDLGGADLCACCGTHVMTTGEIGAIKILSVMGHKGGVRVELFCGTDALSDYQKKHTQLMELSHLLSAAPDEIVSAVKNQQKTISEKDQRIAELNERYFRTLAERYQTNDKNLLLLEEGLNPVELRKCCDYLMKHTESKTVIALSRKSGNEEYNYVIGSLQQDLRALGKEFNALSNGRGGGQKEMIQGSVRADWEAIGCAVTKVFGEFTTAS